jgi:hypothetical protein
MITIIHVHKPAQIVERATATVDVQGEHTYDEVLEAGISALGETKGRLFGYGIRTSRVRKDWRAPIVDETVTVYAVRD